MKENALVIMAKHPYDSPVKTRLAGHIPDEKRIELYIRLLDITVSRLKAVSGVETFISFTPDKGENYFERFGLDLFLQPEGDIGERMHHALSRVLALGYRKAAVVGVDAPDISKETVIKAFELLDRNDIVFGPATDGGYYLVGLKAPAAGIFTGIQWSTQNTLKQSIEAAAKNNLSVALVETLSDVDTIEDAKKAGLV